MTTIDEHGRPEPPPAAGETETLLGYLDYQRATLGWKTAGLDAEGMRATVGRSTMTLGGLLRHLSFAEDYWTSWFLHGEMPPPWRDADWDADPDWDWHSAEGESPDDLVAFWSTTVERSRAQVDRALRAAGLDQLARGAWPSGESPSLRWILVHLIEEYARHNGHADLLREAVDGQTGE
jgi:uncharacterized damage-inducible protein DinB